MVPVPQAPERLAPGHVLYRYGMAMAWSALFIGLRLGLDPVLQEQAPLIVLLAAPLLASWWHGLGPGLLATAVSAVGGDLLFVAPQGALLPQSSADLLRLAIFVIYGAAFSWLIEKRFHALSQARQEHEHLAQAQQALAQREQRMRDTLEASPAGMIVVDRQGTIALVNAQAERLFKLPRAQLVGRCVDELVPEAARAGHAENRARFHANPSARAMGEGRDLWARRGDGSEFPVEIGLTPLEGASSGLVLASVIDISARKKAEQAMREADRRKDEFIAVLAHELRNPLAPVRSAVEILKRVAPAEPRIDRTRAVIERQVSHMARLIDDLLDVSRIGRGKLVLQRERCDLATIARETAEDYRTSIESMGLRLAVHPSPDPLWVDGDPVRLAQMLGNVLTNASRFNKAGGHIEVQMGADPATGMAVVRVVDTGIGIDPELMVRLFDPFEQAGQDLARSRGGLGLGLALTKGLTDLHGGTIEAASAGTGLGAAFTLRLPLAPAQDAPAEDAPAETGLDDRLRILLVEDNPDAAATLGELLSLSGHQVALSLDGSQGLRQARLLRPDVVISDLGLPGEIDGYQLARHLRADPALQAVRLIAVSGYADLEARRRSTEAGYDAHLPKPVDIRTLERLLHVARQRLRYAPPPEAGSHATPA